MMPFLAWFRVALALCLHARIGSLADSGVNTPPRQPILSPVSRPVPNDARPLDPRRANEATPDPASPLRLPTALKPVEYLIKIFPVPLDSDTFNGYVEVDLETVEATQQIHLNMANISLEAESILVTVSRDGKTEQRKVVNHILYPDKQVATFNLDKALVEGDLARLSFFYTGWLVSNTFGLNKIVYNETDGTQKRVLSTYLQPLGARRVFPCLDEPSLKASFRIQVAKREGERVLSNMDVETGVADPNNSTFSWVVFKKSVPMSTYLVAFVISDFKTRSPDHKFVKVWSRKSQLSGTVYASSLALKSLKWLHSYLGVPYPLSKLDLVAFPSYAVPGMENLGLITTEEESLLTTGSPTRRTWVSTVVAHEVAHQWAGNLVTPEWWSQYWLSEGFATYLAARILDEVEPSLEATHSMIVKDTYLILRQDQGDASSRLVVPHFDPLSVPTKTVLIYFKGAAILRMLNTILGEKVFAQGLRHYFKTYQYKSVRESDLFASLSGALARQSSRSNRRNHNRNSNRNSNRNLNRNHNHTLPVPLDQIMKTWTTQSGYPLVTVTRTKDGGITVRQEQFNEFNSTAPHHSATSPPLWWIPLTYTTSRRPSPDPITPQQGWLPPSALPFTLEGVTKADLWLILNTRQTSYLRVNYDAGLWREIAEVLGTGHRGVHLLNRAQVIDDAFHLFETGHIDITPALDILPYLSQERSYFPLRTALTRLTPLEILMRGHQDYPLFKRFGLSFVSPLLAGRFGRTSLEEKRYSLVLSWACRFEDPGCVAEARRTFELFKDTHDVSLFPEGATESLLCSALRVGSPSDWTFVYDLLLLETTDSSLRSTYANALACSQDEGVIRKYLREITSPSSPVSAEDAREIFNSLARSSNWNQLCWAYLRENIEQLEKRFDGLPLPFVQTMFELAQLELLLRSEYVNASQENINLVLEDSERHATKNTRASLALSQWLRRHYSPGASLPSVSLSSSSLSSPSLSSSSLSSSSLSSPSHDSSLHSSSLHSPTLSPSLSSSPLKVNNSVLNAKTV